MQCVNAHFAPRKSAINLSLGLAVQFLLNFCSSTRLCFYWKSTRELNQGGQSNISQHAH